MYYCEYGAGHSPDVLWAEVSAYNMHAGVSLLKLLLELSIIRCTLLDPTLILSVQFHYDKTWP